MIRFKGGMVQFFSGHWRDIPMGLVAGLIALLGVGTYAVMLNGPMWAAIPALFLIIAVPTIILVLLIIHAAHSALEWLNQRRR